MKLHIVTCLKTNTNYKQLRFAKIKKLHPQVPLDSNAKKKNSLSYLKTEEIYLMYTVYIANYSISYTLSYLYFFIIKQMTAFERDFE